MRRHNGCKELAGEFMLVKPLVIDLGWGTLKSALVNLEDSVFTTSNRAADDRRTLVSRYVAAFGHVEAGALAEAKTTLKDLAAAISSSVVPEQQSALHGLVDGRLGKIR